MGRGWRLCCAEYKNCADSVTPSPPRILFVPVTSPRGSGEYARALSIATAVTRRLSGAICHFALSEEAPYAQECPFPATWLPSSPTFHTPQVRALIAEFQPSVVIFDNAGRTAQLRAASQSGARVVFVSSRQRQRRRAYRLGWLRLVDEHWIAYPEFIAGSPTFIERARAAIMGRPVARYLDCLIPDAEAAAVPQDHVLVLTGGVADSRDFAAAPHVMAQAAARLAAENVPVVLVGAPAEFVPSRKIDNLTILPRLTVTDMAARIRAARLVICNGGDTLIQVLALGRACVAIAMAPDQVIRLDRCKRRGLDLRADIDSDQILTRTRTLWHDPMSRAAQIEQVDQLKITNAMDQVIDSIARLGERASRASSTGASLREASR